MKLELDASTCKTRYSSGWREKPTSFGHSVGCACLAHANMILLWKRSLSRKALGSGSSCLIVAHGVVLTIPSLAETSFLRLLALAEDHVVRLDPGTILPKGGEGNSVDGLVASLVAHTDPGADVVVVLGRAHPYKMVCGATGQVKAVERAETHNSCHEEANKPNTSTYLAW